MKEVKLSQDQCPKIYASPAPTLPDNANALYIALSFTIIVAFSAEDGSPKTVRSFASTKITWPVSIDEKALVTNFLYMLVNQFVLCSQFKLDTLSIEIPINCPDYLCALWLA